MLLTKVQAATAISLQKITTNTNCTEAPVLRSIYVIVSMAAYLLMVYFNSLNRIPALTLSRRRNTMAIYRSIRRFLQIYRVTIATIYFKWTIACSYAVTKEMFVVSLQPQIMRFHLQCDITEKQISRERKSDIKFEIWSTTPNFMMPNVRYTFSFRKNYAKYLIVISYE